MDKIVERIRKLLALAGNNPSEAERELALRKAHALLIEHNLQMHDVADKVEEVSSLNANLRFRPVPWTRTVLSGIAALYFCKFLFRRGKRQNEFEVIFVGMRTDAEIALQVSESVLVWLKRAADIHERQHGGEGFTHFINAAANTIYWKCQEMIKSAKTEEAVPGTALIVRNMYDQRQSEAEEWVAKTFGKLGKGKSRKLSVTASPHAAAGIKAAQNVALTLKVR